EVGVPGGPGRPGRRARGAAGTRRLMPERVPSPAGWVALAALGIATVLVYAGVREHDFLLYDDPLYVTENVRVKAGFEPATVVWALVDTHAAHDWHPLTWMSHLADVE